MTHTAKQAAMVQTSYEKLSPGLVILLEGLTADAKIEALLKLSTSVACMAVGVHRTAVRPTPEEFYSQCDRFVCSMLTDILHGPVKG